MDSPSVLLRSMPKVELHLHLEGAIPLDDLWRMIERQGGDPEVPDRDALAARFAFRDFAHFIDTWVWKLQYHSTYADYETMAEAVARSLVTQHILHAEIYVSPTDVRHHGLTVGGVLTSVRRGLDRVPEVSVLLIPDLVRDTGPEMAGRTLDQVSEVAAEAGVAGITIGGSEQLHPPEPFREVFERAQRRGLRLTAHAGEAAGPASVWGALLTLRVDRIGHGVRAVEDPELVANLVVSQTPLEVCPTSNLRTGVVGSWETHPVRTLIDVGAMVTINTDDPLMFGCDLAGEYEHLMDEAGFGWPTVVDLAANAISASWASPDRKAELEAALNAWRHDHGL